MLPEKPAMAMGSVRRAVSLMTVFAQGYSSHAVRKLKMLTDAMGGGQRQGDAQVDGHHARAVDVGRLGDLVGMFSIKPLIMNVEKGMTHAT
jgi:hypothetical protein